MAYPKSTKSALLALAAAGGLWAWQNRHRLSGMVDQARASAGLPAARNELANQKYQSEVEAYTGGTRRIGDQANEI